MPLDLTGATMTKTMNFCINSLRTGAALVFVIVSPLTSAQVAPKAQAQKTQSCMDILGKSADPRGDNEVCSVADLQCSHAPEGTTECLIKFLNPKSAKTVASTPSAPAIIINYSAKK
jgi:hypothetical protein